MKIKPSQYAAALCETTKNVSGEELESRLKNFFKILKQNNDLEKFKEIVNEFKKCDREQRGRELVEITTPAALSRELREKIISKLKKEIKKEIELREKNDPEILGGIIIKINDFLIDASLKGKIQKLSKELLKT